MATRSSRSRPKAGTALPTPDAGGLREIAPAEPAPPPHYLNHRERLRQRFLTGGSEPLPDYELLELVLFAANPRGDVKPLAKQLLQRFGKFENVITAPVEQLRQVRGLKDAGIAALKVAEAAAVRLARDRVVGQQAISSWDALLDYCATAMSHSEVEQFRILYLDRKNVLIRDELQQRGTVDHTPVYPREVVKRALELGACALILVHNHPSGDPTPSRADIAMTREIASAAKALKIDVHDHLVIGRGRHASFKALGLL